MYDNERGKKRSKRRKHTIDYEQEDGNKTKQKNKVQENNINRIGGSR